MLSLFFLTFYEDKKYCIVADTRFKGGCKGYSDMVIASKIPNYAFNPSSNGFVEIFVHSSIQEYDKIEFNSKQLNMNSFHFSGSPFLFSYKENELVMKSLSFDAPGMHVFMYCDQKSTFCVKNFKCFGEIEFRDKVKRNLITIDNFTIIDVLTTSIIRFVEFDELITNIDYALEIVLDKTDKVMFHDGGMHVSEIFVDIPKYSKITLFAHKSLSFGKSSPEAMAFKSLPNIVFEDNDATITFNSIWGVSTVAVLQRADIRADKLTINLENINDAILRNFNIQAKSVIKNQMLYGNNFCLYNANIPTRSDCSHVRYTSGKPISFPLPSDLFEANFYIYDTFPTPAIIDASVYQGKSVNIVGADFVASLSIDLTKGAPNSLTVDHADVKLIGKKITIQNFAVKSGVKLSFADQLPEFSVTNFDFDSDSDFIDYCNFHCNNLILSSDRISLLNEFDENTVDSTTVNFKEGHQITELAFRTKTFQIQFSNIVFRIPNEQLSKIKFVLTCQQNKEIRVKNFFPENYKMKYFPQIIYLNDSSVNYNFDESWEENNVHVESKKGDFFHPTKNNYINTKSNISKLLEIFELRNYIHSSKVFSSGYCISDDESQCGADQQIVPNTDKVLSRIFLPDPYGDCTIKIVSDNVILDMHCFSGINVHLYSTSKKAITLLFRPNVVIPKLEINSLTTKFRTVEKMDAIVIGTLISDTSDIQTTEMNTQLDVRNLMRILAFAYINMVQFLTPSKTRRIELVSSDEYPPISNLIVCPDHFVFEMTSKYSVIANFSMFSTLTYIHASSKATKITITPHNRYGAYLPKMPDFEFLSTSTYISFPDDWFELHPVVVNKGHVSTRHMYPAKIFTPRSVIPDIFVFDEEPIINFFSDRSLCLYRNDASLCPNSYTPFKYTSRKISMKLLEIYTRQLTFFIAESDEYSMPAIDEDIASLDKLTIISNNKQYVAIHADKVLKTLNLLNTKAFIFSESNLPIYNLSMVGSSTINSDVLDIHHASVSVECFNNVFDKFVNTTNIVIMDDNLSTIEFGDDIIRINGVTIKYTVFEHLTVTIMNAIIFSPISKTYDSSKPVVLEFTGKNPSVTFDKSWENVANSTHVNAILKSDASIRVFGNIHNGFSFEKEYISSAAKMCIAGRRDVCPGGYSRIGYTGDPLFLDDQIPQIDLYVIPKKIAIRGETAANKKLRIVSNSPKTVELTYFLIPPKSITLVNVTLQTTKDFSINRLTVKEASSTNGGYDIDALNIDWSARDVVNSFKNNVVECCTVYMPNNFEKLEVTENSYIIWIGSEFFEMFSYNMKRIIFMTGSQYINMSSRATFIETVPSITMMSQGTIFFDGKWENVKSQSNGTLLGMTEVIIDEIFPDHIFTMDPTVAVSILAQDLCLFNDMVSSEECPKGARQIKYSEYSIDLFALPDVWVYVADTTESTPLRIKSRCSYTAIEIFALGTLQDIVFSVPNAISVGFTGITTQFQKSAHYKSIKSDCSEFINSNAVVSTETFSITGATNALNIEPIKADEIVILSSQLISLIAGEKSIVFVDEIDNLTTSLPSYKLIVDTPFTMKVADGVPHGANLMLPSKIEIKEGGRLFIAKEFQQYSCSKKVLIENKDNKGELVTDGSSINNIFEFDDSQIHLETDETL